MSIPFRSLRTLELATCTGHLPHILNLISSARWGRKDKSAMAFAIENNGSGRKYPIRRLPMKERYHNVLPTSAFFAWPPQFSPGNIPPEERVAAAVQKAIREGDDSAFRSSIEKVFRTDWDVLQGSVLHSIILQEGRTVLHDAAMTKGALKIVKTICDHAPFIMCIPDHSGETVWHIAAREKYQPRGLFDILYGTRQLWKKRAADTPTLSVKGVDGGMDELSIQTANIKDGNTALHEALLAKNAVVAQKLFEADKQLCYKLNKDDKSSMNLALENSACDAHLFKSMFEYAAGTALGKSYINTQWGSLFESAVGKGHQGSHTGMKKEEEISGSF